MARRSTEQQILDLEAKIQSIKARAERKKAKANPAVKFMSMALRSIDKALNATEDPVLRKALDEARETVASCLGLCGVKPGAAKRGVSSRRRGKSSEGANASHVEDGNAFPQPDANDLLAYLKNNPGSNSERLTKEFSTDASTLRPVMRKLIDEGKVKTKGERRGTRYFAGA